MPGPPATDILPIHRALISVSDKSGLLPLAQALAARGVEILSTGGSARALRDAGVPVKEVSDHSGFPEILDGRVKTLVPQIHGGILGRRDLPEHLAQMAAHGIAPIDLVVVNLYPFEATVARGAPYDECVENIDIGGPALIRAAAKNHDFVTVLTDPSQYDAMLAEFTQHGGTTLALRRRLAFEAFASTAAYDQAITGWFARHNDTGFPPHFGFAGTLRQELRYGENPHQRAAFYVTDKRPGIATATQVQGKELSYNNLLDLDAAMRLCAEFAGPAATIVKHNNPCGVAVSEIGIADAYRRARETDPVSAFGGIVAVNRTVDGELARELSETFLECVIAPGFAPEALTLLGAKKNLRLLAGEIALDAPGAFELRSVAGGFLVQTRDRDTAAAADAKVVSKRAPTPAELADLDFAWRVCKHVKSNAIVFAAGGRTLGIGAGQMSRVDSVRIAVSKARAPLGGSAVASDAFFPFRDGVDEAAKAGAVAVIQPGGSVRDVEAIAAADEHGMTMVVTGERHFRH